jgi:long-subunit fatty acid transport protein
MKKYFITLLLLAVLPVALYAQEADTDDDFGMDISVAAEKGLTQDLDLKVEANMRTQESTKRIERYLVGGELSYKFLNTKVFDMKVSGGFEYMWQKKMAETNMKGSVEVIDFNDPNNGTYFVDEYNVNERYWRNRHRTSLGISAEYSPNKRWSFQLKETVQYNHYCREDSINQLEYRYDEDDDVDGDHIVGLDRKGIDPKDRFVLRSKLTVEYNIKGIPLNPFASVDYGCGLNYTTNKWKFAVGTDYNINKKNRLSVFYRFQTEDDDDEPNGHIIGIGYKIDL